MAVTTRWYKQGALKFLDGTLDWDTGTWKIALFTSTDTPDVDTDTTYINTNEVTTGGGYTQDSKTLTTPAVTAVVDSSATAHAISTNYDVGDIVRPASANGYVYRCIVAGQSSGTAPTWASYTTIGISFTDNTVTWENAGTSFVKLTAANVSWTTSTITARYAKIYDDTTNDLVFLVDFGQDESSSNGNFDINWNADGIGQAFIQ